MMATVVAPFLVTSAGELAELLVLLVLVVGIIFLGIVKWSRLGRDGVQRARHHAAAVALRHCAAASDRKIRRVEREIRCRCRLNVLWTAA